jgi:hypothetical protein
MLPILVLGLLCTLSIAQPYGDRDSHQMYGDQDFHHMTYYSGHDWLSPNFGYYNWYPSYYYSYPFYSYYYPYSYTNYYYPYYPYYNPYFRGGIEMRPGEATAEWLSYQGIGEPWVGGDPPHSQWSH